MNDIIMVPDVVKVNFITLLLLQLGSSLLSFRAVRILFGISKHHGRQTLSTINSFSDILWMCGEIQGVLNEKGVWICCFFLSF